MAPDVHTAVGGPGRVVAAGDGRTASLWEVPLAPGTLAHWEAVAARYPYVLVNGVLVLRTLHAPRARASR